MGCEPGLRCRVAESPLPQGSQATPALSVPVSQERLEAARQALSETRRHNSSLGEQVQTMRGDLADLELQRVEAEGQLQQLQEVRASVPGTLRLLRWGRDAPTCLSLIQSQFSASWEKEPLQPMSPGMKHGTPPYGDGEAEAQREELSGQFPGAGLSRPAE